MKLLSKPFYLAGVKYSEEARLATIPRGDEVEVSHQPENKYDAFALAVTYKGIRIGHIPRTDQACWFYHTFHNVPVRCVVLDFDRNQPPYEQIKVQFECGDLYMTQVVKQGVIAV